MLNFLSLAFAGEPQHLVFTYMDDPARTLTANWQWLHQPSDDALAAEAVVVYDTITHADKSSDAYTMRTRGDFFSIPGLTDRTLARVQLTNLQPGTTYFLRVGCPESGFSREVKVRTLPDDDRPLRFVTGGDMGVSAEVRTLLRYAAATSPAFSAVGGDIAYANGKLENVEIWDQWLKLYTEEMVTPEGYTVPLVLAIGNHEVRGSYGQPKSEAPFFFNFFGQDPEVSFFKRQFGPNLVLFVLDSGHVASHESQAAWLDRELAASKDIPHKVALYHVPLYPSHRDFMGLYSDLGRRHWAPVFDEHGLTVAFENHDHTFKHSHFIKHGEIVPEGKGTLYLGDGCWGMSARPVTDAPPWYLKKQGAIQHFWLVDCSREQVTCRAVNLENQVFDVYPESATDAPAAEEVFSAIPPLYKLPEGILTAALDLKQQPDWKGGKLETLIHNPFAHPVELWISPQGDRAGFTVHGLPDSPLRLLPGETRSVMVTWMPVDLHKVSWEKLALTYHLKLKLHHPSRDQPIDYAGSAGVKILRP